MTSAEKQKLLRTNALFWIGGTIIFAMVLLAIRLTEGRVSLGIMGILIVIAMWGLAMASNSLLSTAVGPSSDERAADTV